MCQSMLGSRVRYVMGAGLYRSMVALCCDPTNSSSCVDRCSVDGVEWHQCELPNNMELSNLKFPS